MSRKVAVLACFDRYLTWTSLFQTRLLLSGGNFSTTLVVVFIANWACSWIDTCGTPSAPQEFKLTGFPWKRVCFLFKHEVQYISKHIALYIYMTYLMRLMCLIHIPSPCNIEISRKARTDSNSPAFSRFFFPETPVGPTRIRGESRHGTQAPSVEPPTDLHGTIGVDGVNI